MSRPPRGRPPGRPARASARAEPGGKADLAGTIHGLLLVDKPAGPTSHDVVRMVRKALKTRRVGHAGTLDPFATGLLVVGVGRATRLLRWLAASDKSYEGLIRLGFATDSGDVTGRPAAEPRPVGGAASRAESVALQALTGDLEQVPPMHSARKIDGIALYERARRGEVVDREATPVRVGGWRIEAVSDDLLRFEVTCSAGTYVRVLAQDLGELLGCGAHVQALRRTRSGEFLVQDAIPAAELAERGPAALVPLDAIPLPMPSADCADERALAAFLHGAATPLAWWRMRPAGDVAPREGSLAPGAEVACRGSDGSLLGVARVQDGALQPVMVLARD